MAGPNPTGPTLFCEKKLKNIENVPQNPKFYFFSKNDGILPKTSKNNI